MASLSQRRGKETAQDGRLEIGEGKALAEKPLTAPMPDSGKPEPWATRHPQLSNPGHTPTKQLSPDRDLAWLGVLGLGQSQGQDAVFEIGADLLLVDLVRQSE